VISHFTGGNICDPPTGFPDLDWDLCGWDGTLPDMTRTIPFQKAVFGAALLVIGGAHPVIAAAAIQRAWFAEKRATRVTLEGVPDELVTAVRRMIARARTEGLDDQNIV
jgi:hypothetical protein